MEGWRDEGAMAVPACNAVPHHHAQAQRRHGPAHRTIDTQKEGGMIELRLELQPYYDDRESSRNARRVQRGSATSRNSGWSSNSSYGDEREVTFSRPSLPRHSATLEEDTFEYGAVRLREFEL